jgi:hypothetical protein
MLIRFAVIGGAVALAVSAAGAHQIQKIDHGKLNQATAEQLLWSYQVPVGQMPAVFPDGRNSEHDADGDKVAHEGMGHCRHCHG